MKWTYLFKLHQVPAVVLIRVVAGILRTRHVRDAFCMDTHMASWVVDGLG